MSFHINLLSTLSVSTVKVQGVWSIYLGFRNDSVVCPFWDCCLSKGLLCYHKTGQAQITSWLEIILYWFYNQSGRQLSWYFKIRWFRLNKQGVQKIFLLSEWNSNYHKIVTPFNPSLKKTCRPEFKVTRYQEWMIK